MIQLPSRLPVTGEAFPIISDQGSYTITQRDDGDYDIRGEAVGAPFIGVFGNDAGTWRLQTGAPVFHSVGFPGETWKAALTKLL